MRYFKNRTTAISTLAFMSYTASMALQGQTGLPQPPPRSITISGTVRTAAGQSVANIPVSIPGVGNTTTDARGAYSFTVPSGFSGSIVPTPTGLYVFTPPARSVTNVTTPVTAVDFTAAPPQGTTVTISGTVRTAAGQSVADIPVSIPGVGNTTTDARGAYSFTVPSGFSGSVVPTPTGLYVFTPPARSVINVTTPVTAVDFTAAPPQGTAVIISGTVRTVAGQSVADIPVSIPGVGNTTTDARGAYSFTVPSGFSGSVVPTPTGLYVFTPPARSVINVTTPVTDLDFLASSRDTVTGPITQPTAPSLAIACAPGVGPSIVAVAHAEACTVAGGSAPYRWSISQGALPEGLALSATTGVSISIAGTPTVPGNYAFTLSVTDGGTPAQTGARPFSGTLAPRPVKAFNAASFIEGTVAPESIATISGRGLALRVESSNGTPPTTLGGAAVTVTDSLGTTREAQMFYASDGQINFLIPPATTSGTATVAVTKLGVAGAVTGVVNVANLAPGIFVLSGGSTVPAAFYLRVTASGQRIQDLTFDPAKLSVSTIPRGSGDQIYLLLYGTGFRRNTGRVTATANGESVPVLGALAQGQHPGLDQVNIGPLPVNLASGTVTLRLTFDGVSANDITVRLQ